MTHTIGWDEGDVEKIVQKVAPELFDDGGNFHDYPKDPDAEYDLQPLPVEIIREAVKSWLFEFVDDFVYDAKWWAFEPHTHVSNDFDKWLTYHINQAVAKQKQAPAQMPVLVGNYAHDL